jgi:hypothetical protein
LTHRPDLPGERTGSASASAWLTVGRSRPLSLSGSADNQDQTPLAAPANPGPWSIAAYTPTISADCEPFLVLSGWVSTLSTTYMMLLLVPASGWMMSALSRLPRAQESAETATPGSSSCRRGEREDGGEGGGPGKCPLDRNRQSQWPASARFSVESGAVGARNEGGRLAENANRLAGLVLRLWRPWL